MTLLLWIAWWLLWASCLFAAFVIMAQRRQLHAKDVLLDYLRCQCGQVLAVETVCVTKAGWHHHRGEECRPDHEQVD